MFCFCFPFSFLFIFLYFLSASSSTLSNYYKLLKESEFQLFLLQFVLATIFAANLQKFWFQNRTSFVEGGRGGRGVLQCIHAQCWKREHKHDNIAWHFLLESIVFINIIRLLDSIFFFQQILEILKISQWQIFLSCDFLFELGKQKKKQRWRTI